MLTIIKIVLNVSFYGAIILSESRPPHYRDFTLTFREATLDKTLPDEWSAINRDIYLTKPLNQKSQISMPQPDSNPQSQYARGCRPTR